MKFAHISVIAVMLVVIAIAVAGCTSTQTTTPSGSTSQGSASTSSAAASPSSAAGSQSSGSSVAAGSSASASDLFGGLSYNWIEYKMSSSSSGQSITMYIKWEKSGKCTMRFEGAGAQGMPSSMDCSSTGKAQSNPNDASSTPSDVKYTYVGPDVVTVPAGTFTADKYTATVNGNTATYWIVKDKGLVKMVSNAGEGSSTMELNGMG
ncbi:MAG: hypothetical protein ABSG49_08755 [Methanoregula sp.]|jgi:hypothetical protein|uniref:hypothetical protein n=1 Tax=Methanoregula sp. TaxID=2052170 RepID=UPI003C26D64B